MCPFCLASVGLIVAGATSAGGLTALAVKLSSNKTIAKEISSKSVGANGLGKLQKAEEK